MYQFYYAEQKYTYDRDRIKDDIRKHFAIEAVRPAMWEEHCLECSAPDCFHTCPLYEARKDGRCKRFYDGLNVFADERACCGQGVHVRFRKWANMMTVLFPAMLDEEHYRRMFAANEKRGRRLRFILNTRLPLNVRWQTIRTIEFIRRRNLRKLEGLDNTPDAFLFHGYSYASEPFRLIVDVFKGSSSAFKTSLMLKPGENLYVIPASRLSDVCGQGNNLVKVYPENDIEAELDILWCDFVKGKEKHSGSAKTVKCVVWDLDQTLWDGVLIESDPDTLQLRPGVMDTIQWLDQHGIVQSIASKNDHEPAWNVVERLGIAEYFLYPQISWGAKSEAMRTIASELNIGIDSLALIDDSPFERNQVASVYPQVRTYDENVLSSIPSREEFQTEATEESAHRRQMYQEEASRKHAQTSRNDDLIGFLHSCHLKLELFEPASEAELLRCYEIVNRTNQLNLSGRKYTEEEFRTILARSGYHNTAFACEDDFGKYGIVGFCQYAADDENLNFSEFAMSCRAAGKYVESALFEFLLDDTGCKQGYFTVSKTEKNKLLRNTLTEAGFTVVSENDTTVQYRFARGLNHADIVAVAKR